VSNAEYLDQVREAEQKLRDATREAHEALKDLRTEHKEIKVTLTDWKKELDDEFGEYLRKELNMMGDQFERASRASEAKVFKKWDEIIAVMMGEDGTDRDSIPDLLRRMRSQYPRVRRLEP